MFMYMFLLKYCFKLIFFPTDCAVLFCHKVVYYFLLVIWFLYDLEQEQYTLNNYNCYIFILKFYVFISALPILHFYIGQKIGL